MAGLLEGALTVAEGVMADHLEDHLEDRLEELDMAAPAAGKS